MKKLYEFLKVKLCYRTYWRQWILVLVIFLISLSNFAQSQQYSSIEEVKKLNYELFEEIGFDENQMNHVCRAIYSTQKRASYLAENGVSPNKEKLDQQFKSLILRVLSEEEFKKFESIRHKLK
ncbi:MAG: hypothetical protein HN773_06695 [Flavobacteriaceae bacterium]|jgi:hypothetical protein|nr:hypothetical protein [Flavobacteriaceae bacterium]MBT4113550.1 hypothetical protein [Flavobacteriaceae bacterium]MBT4614795.1 hypothetical protein [Flavobacteriaceae bacterium]MBT5246558.1 hypothetical protein [Flavobacteriaceae bacterium]MBT5649825.1 hypothetical protein [Flavobacteriaceae bacterium]|tara:strand:- start:693 stop:1061 length:369 start_codon:yes stop_codon:yes gene_type:complete